MKVSLLILPTGSIVSESTKYSPKPTKTSPCIELG